MFPMLVAATVAFGLGVFLGSKLLVGRRPKSPQAGAGSDVGTGTLMDWIVRATGASGCWIKLGDGLPVLTEGRGDAGPLHDPIARGRLETLLLAQDDREGVERIDDGTLVFVARPPRAGILLLPREVGTDRALLDLQHLLQLLATHSTLDGIRPSRGGEGESIESMAIRLAHQVERLCEGDVIVAVRSPIGVEILGVALRGDQRLLHARVTPGSSLDQVARGEVTGPLVSYNPTGFEAGSDRRSAVGRATVISIEDEGGPLGSVAYWSADGAGELTGARAAALGQALGAAGPRFRVALERREERDAATRDPLTGLRNRRGFQEVFGEVTVGKGVLIYADLDHFKRLNDTLGHAAGDAALVHFAGILGDLVRGRDISARLGGEEFAIWIPGGEAKRGVAVAERVRGALSERSWHWQGQPWSITASFGVAAWPDHSASRENLSALADEALYRAKREGRDRVCAAETMKVEQEGVTPGA